MNMSKCLCGCFLTEHHFYKDIEAYMDCKNCLCEAYELLDETIEELNFD